ncbi:benzaldehyde dehydrogenase [Streptomyces sp. 150FB]|uniref:benzaldehyde dehydrogenase n=1 Tax=Streptomyces sp. 150FB TaxID=1576605 RepID=UPI001F384E09|nr:benzaldehyde dehydrogenase [Streptomyces sp. 150FB]
MDMGPHSLLDTSPLKWHGKIFDGEWRDAEGGAIPVVEPATGKDLGTVGAASVRDVRRCVTRAREARAAWAAAPYIERAGVLRRAAELWTEHSTEVQDWLMRESGGVRRKAMYELRGAVQECLEAAALPSHALGEVLPSEKADLSMSRRVPVGVVAVIAPFNLPLKLSIRSVAPALALGNAVLLKPDPRTPVSGGLVLARIFEEAGLPPGLLHILPGGADIGSALVTDPGVRAVSFTGSSRTGRVVGELAARHLTRAHLELGGNSALIVMADADLDRAVPAAAHGSFFHQGQGCMVVGRHLVHESIYDTYVERLAEKAGSLTVGNPMTEDVALGPLIDEHQRDSVHALVTGSVDAGARLLTGGTYNGLFYRPTVLANTGPGAPAYENEVFGPVASVTPFATADDAVRLANDSVYGLSLGVLTADVGAGLALADRIPTGTAHINDQTLNDDANAPFGGMGESGNASRFGGAAANIEAYTDTRWITARATIPSYPM